MSTRALAADAKRLHIFQEMRHATADFLVATHEQMCLHIDLKVRRVAPWPAAQQAKLEAAVAAQAHLPVPPGVGRRIGMSRPRL